MKNTLAKNCRSSEKVGVNLAYRDIRPGGADACRLLGSMVPSILASIIDFERETVKILGWPCPQVSGSWSSSSLLE